MTGPAFRHVQRLPDHSAVLREVLDCFRPQAVAGFVCGSVARGGMDLESDLDIGICFADDAAREAAWASRWDWPLPSWFHRFDADHVKPHFVIYLFDPKVKADIALYMIDDLPSADGGPYVMAWDHSSELSGWAERAVPPAGEVDWSSAVHEDERFWAWQVFCLQHVRRGEYYSIASEIHALRDIVEQWQARLIGQPFFTVRRAESIYDTAELARAFPAPNAGELKEALLTLIEIHDRQRARLDLPWRTSDQARAQITAWVREL